MYGYIYKTTNLLNGKIYVGQHKGHSFDAAYYGSGSWFRATLKKYGKHNFTCEMIDSCETLPQLNEREIYWIERLQSRNPSIGYNLAKGGEQVTVGCTEKEIKYISNLLLSANIDTIYDVVSVLQGYGLKIYEKGDGWEPTSNNSKGVKMKATDNSVIVSFYTKNQYSLAKQYANCFDCTFWKYNLMIEIDKIPDFLEKIANDYQRGKIVAETFKGPGRGTTGIFFETQKHTKSARMPLDI